MTTCYWHTKCKMDDQGNLIFFPMNTLNILPTVLFALLTYEWALSPHTAQNSHSFEGRRKYLKVFLHFFPALSELSFPGERQGRGTLRAPSAPYLGQEDSP